jgi:hypothetical protein
MVALTRTCRLEDFPGCRSVADWQQQIAEAAYARWRDAPHVETATEIGWRLIDAPILCVNWSHCAFRAPGPPSLQHHHQWGDLPRPPYCDPSLALGAVFALSVLDRIEAPIAFLRRQAHSLRAGGLICCTFAYWDASGPDCAIGHEIRQRIYDANALNLLVGNLRKLDLHVYGGIDGHYHGHTLADHTLATLVLTKGAS